MPPYTLTVVEFSSFRTWRWEEQDRVSYELAYGKRALANCRWESNFEAFSGVMFTHLPVDFDSVVYHAFAHPQACLQCIYLSLGP